MASHISRSHLSWSRAVDFPEEGLHKGGGIWASEICFEGIFNRTSDFKLSGDPYGREYWRSEGEAEDSSVTEADLKVCWREAMKITSFQAVLVFPSSQTALLGSFTV